MPTERKAETAKPKNETTYIVLEGGAGVASVEILGDTLANGPEQAVRRVVPDREGKFVAIPARNWTIVDQESETPPPVITQTISKWAGLDEPEPEPESLAVDATDAVPDRGEARAEARAAETERAQALAAAIEDDGA